jgi:hypothetical protein
MLVASKRMNGPAIQRADAGVADAFLPRRELVGSLHNWAAGDQRCLSSMISSSSLAYIACSWLAKQERARPGYPLPLAGEGGTALLSGPSHSPRRLDGAKYAPRIRLGGVEQKHEGSKDDGMSRDCQDSLVLARIFGQRLIFLVRVPKWGMWRNACYRQATPEN